MADTYRVKINISGQFNTLQKGTLIGALDLVAGAVVPQTAPVALTDNSGGTADDTVAAVPAATAASTDTSAASLTSTNTALTAIKNDIADLTAKINAIINTLSDVGVFS